jgi:hypothetical protein
MMFFQSFLNMISTHMLSTKEPLTFDDSTALRHTPRQLRGQRKVKHIFAEC